MEHIGIDLGTSRSDLCVVRDGKVTREYSARTHDLWELFAGRPRARIVLESCAESRKIALWAREHGHQVRVVPTTFVRALGIGARRIKTNKRDARNLALASFRLGDELPHIHIRSDEAASLQELVRSRAKLISMRTAAINFVRAHLRRHLKGRPGRAADSFCRRVYELLGESVPLEIRTHLQQIEQLNEQIALLEHKMKQCAQSEPAQRLQKISGIGTIVAVSFIAAIDDPKRFKSASNVASYLGLSPGEDTTGHNVRRTGVIAAGQKELRTLLVQAAHSMLNSRCNDPLAQWARELEARSGRKVAACALARRIAVVMWAMLRDGTRYDPPKTRPRHPRPSVAHQLSQVLADQAAASLS